MSSERLEKLRTLIARRQPDLSVVMENVHKPHNFSAVVRTCDAVGVLNAHAVVLERTNANMAVTQGADKWVRIHQHSNVADAIAAARRSGQKVIAAHLSPRAIDFRAYDYTQPTAILLGQELGGVTDEALALVDTEVVIPMVGMTASLNVSVAAAVILYEAQRQREAKGMYARSRMDAAAADALLFEYLHPDMADYYARRSEPYPPIDADGHIVFTKSPSAP